MNNIMTCENYDPLYSKVYGHNITYSFMNKAGKIDV